MGFSALTAGWGRLFLARPQTDLLPSAPNPNLGQMLAAHFKPYSLRSALVKGPQSSAGRKQTRALAARMQRPSCSVLSAAASLEVLDAARLVWGLGWGFSEQAPRRGPKALHLQSWFYFQGVLAMGLDSRVGRAGQGTSPEGP